MDTDEDYKSYVVVIDTTSDEDKQNGTLNNDNNGGDLIKQEMDFNGVNCTNTENNATNFDTLMNIKPDIDANSLDYDTNDTNSKDNGNNTVNFDSLNIKLEVDSIDVNCVNTVKDENSFQSSTIKPVNVYANYGATEIDLYQCKYFKVSLYILFIQLYIEYKSS